MSTSKSFVRRSFDTGLRQYMLNVYSYMGLGLGLTGAVAASIGLASVEIQVFFSNFLLLSTLGSLGITLYFAFALNRMAASTAQTLFWVYSILMGISMSRIFALYSMGSVAQAFFVTSLTFGAMTVYGHTTKRDLTSMGSFLFMALIGLIVAQVVNMFFRNSGLDFILSGLGVLIFTGLTAYDTQRLGQLYFQLPQHGDTKEKAAVFGALTLYLDVINLFLYFLRLTDRQK